MKITIDGKKKKFDLSGVDNLQTLFELAYDWIGKDGKVVLNIFLDNSELTPEEEAEMGNEPLSGFQEVAFQTASKEEIAKSAIGESFDMIKKFKEKVHSVSEEIQQGKAKKAGSSLVRLLTDLDDLLEVFASVRVTSGVDMKKIKSNGMNLDEIESDLIIAISKLAETSQEGTMEPLLEAIRARLLPAIENFEQFLYRAKEVIEAS